MVIASWILETFSFLSLLHTMFRALNSSFPSPNLCMGPTFFRWYCATLEWPYTVHMKKEVWSEYLISKFQLRTISNVVISVCGLHVFYYTVSLTSAAPIASLTVYLLLRVPSCVCPHEADISLLLTCTVQPVYDLVIVDKYTIIIIIMTIIIIINILWYKYQ